MWALGGEFAERPLRGAKSEYTSKAEKPFHTCQLLGSQCGDESRRVPGSSLTSTQIRRYAKHPLNEGHAVEDDEQSTDGRRERDYEIGRLMAFSDGVFAVAI